MTNPAAQTPGPDHASVTPNAWVPSPAARKAIYGIAAAVGALLVAYGVVGQDQVTLWLELFGNLLLIGSSALALVNTPKGK